MSEALNSREIEDVLSSIRRLVSDDLRPASRPATGAQPQNPAAEPDKLLLTPALRVVQSEPAAQDLPPPAIDAVVAAVSAGVDQQVDDWESETGDIAPVAPDTAPDAAADMAPMAEDALEGDWEDHQIDAYAEPVAFRSAREVTAVAEVLAETGAAAPDLPGWAQSYGADEAEAPTAESWSGGTVEPDRAWADEAEAAVLQELSGAGPLPQAEADVFVMKEAEAVEEPELPVDEAMLREIVRDVLREELQGRLGERITRNIRKLVRAEIARVMASEDLL